MRDTGRGEFYFAVVKRPGRPADGGPAGAAARRDRRAALAEIDALPGRRRCAGCGRSVSAICLFDGEVLRCRSTACRSAGRRAATAFCRPGEIAVGNAAEYLAKLEAAHVVLDPDRRRDLIAGDLDRLAAGEGLRVKPDPALLDEVTGLVEYPVVLIGTHRRGEHGTAARGARDRDADAPEVFLLPQP